MQALTAREKLFRPLTRSHKPPRTVLLLAVSLLGVAAFRLSFFPHLGDLRVYLAEGRALRDGLPLHGHLPGVDGLATYPPFAACCFWLLTFLPFGLLGVLSVISNVTLVGYAAFAAFRLLGLDRTQALTAGSALFAVGLWSEPVIWTTNYGQINLWLLALVLWDFTRAPGSPLRGVGVGLATALKVTPAIFIVYLVLTKRFRAAATAAATLLLTIGVSALADARSTWRYWTHDLFDSGRVGRLENAVNQTVRGMLVRIDHTRNTPHAQLLLVLVVLVAGLSVSRYAYLRLGEAWGLVAAAVTGLLSSPISWSHHWVWCVPIGALLWHHVRWAVVPAFLVFCSCAVWAIPHTDSKELRFAAWQIALSGWYVYFGLLLLALIGVRAHRAGSHDVGQSSRDPAVSREPSS